MPLKSATTIFAIFRQRQARLRLAPPCRRVGDERPHPLRLPEREPVREMRPGGKSKDQHLIGFHAGFSSDLGQSRLDLPPAPLLGIVVSLFLFELLRGRLKRRGQQNQPMLVCKATPSLIQHRTSRPIIPRHQQQYAGRNARRLAVEKLDLLRSPNARHRKRGDIGPRDRSRRKKDKWKKQFTEKHRFFRLPFSDFHKCCQPDLACFLLVLKVNSRLRLKPRQLATCRKMSMGNGLFPIIQRTPCPTHFRPANCG